MRVITESAPRDWKVIDLKRELLRRGWAAVAQGGRGDDQPNAEKPVTWNRPATATTGLPQRGFVPPVTDSNSERQNPAPLAPTRLRPGRASIVRRDEERGT